MTTENDNHNDVLFTESPASWNTRYVTEDGFTCQLTLRADNGQDLLARANSALVHLRQQGCRPFFGYGRNNGYQDNKDQSPNNVTTSDEDPRWCSVHQCWMKRREKGGKVWYSHQELDGFWCKGK